MVLAHALTLVQKAAKVLQLPSLGNQRPSEMMASLMEFCPPGETGTAMFRASFISRLPPLLQIHLSRTEMGDIKELTQAADRLRLCHGPQLVAAVQVQQETEEELEETVAAVTWKGRGPPSKKAEGSSSAQQSGGRSGSGKQGGGQQKKNKKKATSSS